MQKIKRYSSQTQLNLPKRPKGNYQQNFRKIDVTSNHFRVQIKNLDSIYLYKVDFQPKLEENDRLKRNAIYSKCNSTISQYIQTPVCSGNLIYTTKKPAWGDTKDISLKFDEKDINMKVKLVKTIKFSERNSNNQKMQLSFLNNLLRTSMRRLNFIEIGNSRRFFDSTSRKVIKDLDMVIYQGYTANFCKLETGLFLKVDSVSKIVRRETVLQFIDDLYQRNADKNKVERRQIVFDTLKGQTIMANYGRSMYWRIQNILFDQEAQSFNIGDRQITIAEYYKQKYGLSIQVKKQPLIEAKTRNETIVLIPEFCLMTGMPENIDQRKRRQISLFTSKTVDEKVERINKFREKLDIQLKDINPEQLKDKLGINIEKKLAQVDCKKIDNPKLQLGSGNAIQKGREANFKLFDKPLFDCHYPINLGVLHFSNFDFTPIKKLFQSTSKNLGLALQMKTVNVGQFSAARALQLLSNEIKLMHAKKAYNIFLIVLPAAGKNIYKHLKKLCYCELGVLLQVVQDGILKKKQFQSVATKVLLQLAAKVGNVLWVPRNNIIQKYKVMVIGINTSSQKSSKGKKRIGYCASINGQLTKFFSESETQDISCGIIQHMQNLVLNSIRAYMNSNKTLPSEIIILRDGCSQSQVSSVLQFEVQACKKAIASFESSISLNFVVIDKKPSQKFFCMYDNRYQNPPAGTIINSDLVSSNYDFYLISQQASRGSTIPTYYQVLYNNSKLEEGMIQEIVYDQCFNYCNWTGSIKIPSPIQYAKKLCEFLSTNLNESPAIKLQKFFYYI